MKGFRDFGVWGFIVSGLAVTRAARVVYGFRVRV